MLSVTQFFRKGERAWINLITIRKVLKMTLVHFKKDNYVMSQIIEFVIWIYKENMNVLNVGKIVLVTDTIYSKGWLCIYKCYERNNFKFLT